MIIWFHFFMGVVKHGNVWNYNNFSLQIKLFASFSTTVAETPIHHRINSTTAGRSCEDLPQTAPPPPPPRPLPRNCLLESITPRQFMAGTGVRFPALQRAGINLKTLLLLPDGRKVRLANVRTFRWPAAAPRTVRQTDCQTLRIPTATTVVITWTKGRPMVLL